MWTERENVVLGIAMLVQLVGFIGVLAARLSQHRLSQQQLSQQRRAGRLSGWLVVICICLVGIISLATMETCDQGWLAFATTLPLMAVGATIDFRKNLPGAAF